MTPKEIEELADRIEQHNKWRMSGNLEDYPQQWCGHTLGEDTESAVALLRDMAKEHSE